MEYKRGSGQGFFLHQSAVVFIPTKETLLFLLADADLKYISLLQFPWRDQKFTIMFTMMVYNILVTILIII